MTCARTQKIQLSEDIFGRLKDGTIIKRFTWINQNKVSVQLITYGACITSIKVPGKDGRVEDVVIGFDTLEEYLQPRNAYFGATIGRFANRIAKGKMSVEGRAYQLATNDGPNHLHGGTKGFDKVIWDAHVEGTVVTLSYKSEDMEEGYPGVLLANVSFQLTDDDIFRIEYRAMTSKPTPVNLTNHSYFNLAGHGAGPEGLYQHVVSLNADRVTEVDGESIPTGSLQNVSGTVFDLRIPRLLGDVIHKVPGSPGYDHNFCVSKGESQDEVFVARVSHPESGRAMEVYSNQPGVQFYTGNFLPEDGTLKGKGAPIQKHGALCLETQTYPDAINQKNFPDPVLRPGKQYNHTTVFKFYTAK